VTDDDLARWARFRAARTWRVLVAAEGAHGVAVLTPEGSVALAAKLPGTPVVVERLLEHVPFADYERDGGPAPEAVVGRVQAAECTAGIGVTATLHLAPSKRVLHDLLLVLHAAGALHLGPSLVFDHSGPGIIVADVLRVYALALVWCPGLGGRFLAPREEAPA
jgi:hypothetical protein